MSLTGQHQWFTVRGGSIEYVRRLQAELTRQAVDIRLATPIAGVKREGGHVYVRAVAGEWETFDDLVSEIEFLRSCSSPFVVKYYGSYKRDKELFVSATLVI